MQVFFKIGQSLYTARDGEKFKSPDSDHFYYPVVRHYDDHATELGYIRVEHGHKQDDGMLIDGYQWINATDASRLKRHEASLVSSAEVRDKLYSIALNVLATH